MSFAALAAVSKMRARSAAEKLVALAYADRHNEETGCAYPSLAALCEFSSLNRKTVIAAVARLETIGLLTDTGERKGDTRQIKVYRLNLESIPKSEPSQKRDRSQKRNSSDFAVEQSQKRDTEPVREPASTEASPPPKPRATAAPKLKPFRLPADWKPVRFPDDTVARDVVDRRGREWARAALESFRNWAANADDKNGHGRKVDWQAAWANWIIKQDRDDGRRGGSRSDGVAGHGGLGPTARAALRVAGRSRGAAEPLQPEAGVG